MRLAALDRAVASTKRGWPRNRDGQPNQSLPGEAPRWLIYLCTARGLFVERRAGGGLTVNRRSYPLAEQILADRLRSRGALPLPKIRLMQLLARESPVSA